MMKTTDTPIRVLVVDDQEFIRKGLCALLSTKPDIAVVAEAQSGRQAIAQAACLQPDLILLDQGLPDINGFDATRRIKAQQPAAQIVILTNVPNSQREFAAVQAGAVAYLSKDIPPQAWARLIRRVHRGHIPLASSFARHILHLLADSSHPLAQRARFTRQEIHVLEQIAAAHHSHDAEPALDSAHVQQHMRAILHKIQGTDRPGQSGS